MVSGFEKLVAGGIDLMLKWITVPNLEWFIPHRLDY